jgi:hypothetical protein
MCVLYILSCITRCVQHTYVSNTTSHLEVSLWDLSRECNETKVVIRMIKTSSKTLEDLLKTYK